MPPQFASAGVPLLAAPSTPAMDANCCCGPGGPNWELCLEEPLTVDFTGSRMVGWPDPDFCECFTRLDELMRDRVHILQYQNTFYPGSGVRCEYASPASYPQLVCGSGAPDANNAIWSGPYVWMFISYGYLGDELVAFVEGQWYTNVRGSIGGDNKIFVGGFPEVGSPKMLGPYTPAQWQSETFIKSQIRALVATYRLNRYISLGRVTGTNQPDFFLCYGGEGQLFDMADYGTKPSLRFDG